jgi:hypothetical protein
MTGISVASFINSCKQDFTMRGAVKIALPLISASVLAACSIHPVQQDVTGVPPRSIVDRIRCEARLAVLDKAINVVRRAAATLRATTPLAANKFDAVAITLESQRGGPIDFDPRNLPTDGARSFYGRYINTVIAYDFLTQGTETNTVALAADPVRLITNGTVGITLGGRGELSRDNQRHFAIADSFEELLYDRTLKCESSDYLPENFIYPVSGRVGLREVIDTFIELNEDKPLSKFPTSKTVFADTLKFTTTWSGGTTPHFQIDPVGTRLGLDSPTNIALSASRVDTHTLTVGLAMGPPLVVPAVGTPTQFAARSGSRAAGQMQQSNKDAAFEAIDELRYRSFLDRAGTFIGR